MKQRLNYQWIFAFSYDVAIRFVLLSVIQGITVDTFSELRLAKIDRLRDTFEICFICGIDKQVFDRDKSSRGFKAHIKKEHNMWNYLYFIIYIWEQDKDDDDGLEQYVRRSIDADDISWLPANKAMALNIVNENSEAETKEKFVDDMRAMETNFVSRLTTFQTDVGASVMKIKQLLDTNSGNEVTMVQAFDAPEVNSVSRPMTEPNKTHSFSSLDDAKGGCHGKPRKGMKKFNTVALMDHGGADHKDTRLVIIEIAEIVGLSFASRTLDSITCFIRSECGVEEVKNSHVMIQDHAPSLVLFDPRSIVVNDDWSDEKSSSAVNDMVIVQIAQGSPPKYLGKVQFTLAELTSEPQQRLEKSFVAEILGSSSKGTLVVNTAVKSSFVYENT
jgi:hypothetical protein